MAVNKIIGDIETGEVFIDGKQLDPKRSQKLRNHSPNGFSWGYGGSGPAQLALAILLEFMSEEFALKWYQVFKANFVAKLPQTDFEENVDIFELAEKISRQNKFLYD